ncbi:hypothetical protein AN641_02795 [Candidatus Epulonipiscioides gigas]|nr:hypothetical protein AN641_02795 [Epulopiscium sp. SCG-C07WGA-EpuloA2]
MFEFFLVGVILFFILVVSSQDIKVRNKQQLGVPFSKILYADVEENADRLLISSKLDLQGKPDYIFQNIITRQLIPLELKSGTIKTNLPNTGDIYQLVAYFLIIQEVYGKKPPYGKLVYSNKTFIIKNSLILRTKTLRQINLMRKILDGNLPKNHSQNYIKCRTCQYQKTICQLISKHKN